MMKKINFALISILLTGCSWLGFNKSENLESEQTADTEAAELPHTENSKKSEVRAEPKASMDSLELKHAQLWARVDELEGLIQKQKQKIKLLEQGLMLGIVPEEMKESLAKIEKETTPKEMKTEEMNEKDLHGSKDHAKNADPKYKDDLDAAKLLFQSGRYGKAYLSFSKIEKEYENKITDGEEKYWLGRCWEKLKEFQSSKKHFEDFLTQYPNSPLNVSAKFYLGKVELEMGLKELAIKRFQEIIQEHPYDGTSEAAKQVLANLKNSL